MLHTHLALLVDKFCALASERLSLQVAQRTHLVLMLRLPIVNDGRAGCCVKPATRAFKALILPEPAQGFEKDRAGQVFGQSKITDFAVDKALQLGGIHAVKLRQTIQMLLSTRVVCGLHRACHCSFLKALSFFIVVYR